MTLSLNNTLSKQICAQQLHHTLVISMKLGGWASPLLHLSARVLPCSFTSSSALSYALSLSLPVAELHQHLPCPSHSSTYVPTLLQACKVKLSLY